MFPISYIFGDILTEVYGYARSREIIWTGFIANGLMAFIYWIVIKLPPARILAKPRGICALTLGQVPRIVLASFVAYLIGEFANSFVLAKMKIRTKGRHLWARTLFDHHWPSARHIHIRWGRFHRSVAGEIYSSHGNVALRFQGALRNCRYPGNLRNHYFLKEA